VKERRRGKVEERRERESIMRDIQCESKKVAPLKLFAIFSLRLSIFP